MSKYCNYVILIKNDANFLSYEKSTSHFNTCSIKIAEEWFRGFTGKSHLLFDIEKRFSCANLGIQNSKKHKIDIRKSKLTKQPNEYYTLFNGSTEEIKQEILNDED